MGQRFRIRLSADALDNLVLGSNPTAAHVDFNEGIYADSQASPTTGVNGFEDALLVREVFGSWNFLGLIDLDFGRMNDHFGSGLIRNRGDCVDCDRGSYIDGLRAGLDLFGVRAEARDRGQAEQQRKPHRVCGLVFRASRKTHERSSCVEHARIKRTKTS